MKVGLTNSRRKKNGSSIAQKNQPTTIGAQPKREQRKKISQLVVFFSLAIVRFVLSLHDMVMCLIKYNGKNMWNAWYHELVPVGSIWNEWKILRSRHNNFNWTKVFVEWTHLRSFYFRFIFIHLLCLIRSPCVCVCASGNLLPCFSCLFTILSDIIHPSLHLNVTRLAAVIVSFANTNALAVALHTLHNVCLCTLWR